MVQTSRGINAVNRVHSEGVIARHFDRGWRPRIIHTDYAPGEEPIRVGGCVRYVPPWDIRKA